MVTTRRLPLLLLGLCALAPPLVLAQAPQKPKPGPEHQRLAFFVGKWKGEAEVKQNPFMPAGKHTSTDSCEWFEGRFAVVCRNESRGGGGTMRSLGLIGYSPEEKVYTYYGVESTPMAMTSVSRGTVDGGTWIFTDESKMGGKTIKSRYTIRETSPTSYTFTWEMQGDDGSWATVIEGTQKKAK